MELLMSRYILEVEKDTSLFNKFGNGWYPNLDEYRLFLHKQEKNNESFSKLITRYRLVKKEDHIIETVASKDLESISFFLKREATIMQSSYGTIRVVKDILTTLEYPSCYISNGFYHDTEEIAFRLVGCGSFIVGVCDNPESIFYQENLERMIKFEKILRKKHIPYKNFHHNNHRDKCVVLAYRSDKL